MVKKHILFLLVILALMPSVSYASDYSGYEIYETQPTFSPYYAGKVRSEVLESALEELNYVRWLMGLPDDVALDDEYTEKAQHAAVLLDTIGRLNHTPERPSDMSEEFYSLAYAGTSSSNLAQGTSLQGSIALYMDDSDVSNIPRLGHRRWLMNPKMTHTGFGMSVRGKFSATYVFQKGGDLEDFFENVLGRTYSGDASLNMEEYELYSKWDEERRQWPISDDFVSWPTSKTEHPLYYFGGNTAWCVVLNRNIFEGFNETGKSGVFVRLTRTDDGQEWTFSNSNSDGYFNIDTGGYGDGECIIFRPDGVGRYNNGEKWHAEISGLVRSDGGSGGNVISFDVIFTDALTGYESEAYLEGISQQNQDTSTDSDNNPQQNTGGGSSSGGGGCNTIPLVVLTGLILGIPRRRKSLRAGQNIF